MNVSRRGFLTRAAVVTAAAAIPGSLLLSAPAYAAQGPDPDRIRASIREARARHARVLSGVTSSNGWEMEKIADDRGNIYTRPVPGTPIDGVQVRIGDAEIVLLHVVRRFHYEIDSLRREDVVGWSAPEKVRRSHPESNLASGTGIRIRPESYPAGAHGGFFSPQVAVIRDILAELDGVVRWGGDDRTPDEALFYLDVQPGDPRLGETVTRLRDWEAHPGQGAGVLVDVHAPGRRKAAKNLERRQRRAA
ncbi:twin-arginine translocation signal domain-containing protein [Streptomyces sp. NPDC057287]|uniref:twin-arginine translocation signal domain-containing protein n=1 Tax=Streptomyces sp. NPDC057287 TaxID=3346086 RepID=UPI0036414051